mgnify:CR=1 FL=1
MEMKNEQKIKGDNNLQTNITVSGDLNIGLQRNDVINLIKEFCFTDKNQIIDIVKRLLNQLMLVIAKCQIREFSCLSFNNCHIALMMNM